MIWYQLINFAIVITVLIIVGRKIVKKIFGGHKESVKRDLMEAEKGFERSRSVEKLIEEENEKAISQREALLLTSERHRKEAIDAASAGVVEAEEARRAEIKRELKARRVDMYEKLRRRMLHKVAGAVTELVAGEPYFSMFRAAEEKIIDATLPMLSITNGDRVYLLKHDVLYVTLISAFELKESLIKKVEDKVTELLNEVNGKPSFRVLVDPSLIAGVQIRIGDTVYDSTLKNHLYNLTTQLGEDSYISFSSSDELYESMLSQIQSFEIKTDIYQRGRVISVSDGICWLDGLADIMYGELVEFDCGERGMILDIEDDRIGCVVFGAYEHIQEYSRVRRLGKMAGVAVGDKLLGRILGPLGEPIDGKGSLHCKDYRPIEFRAPGIIDRQAVNEPLYTGLKVVDALIPVGKGQRELIIGDRQTGKTAIAIDTIINQKGKNVICIYVGIGQKETTIASIAKKLSVAGAMSYTVIVSATASQTAPMLYVAPYAGAAIGEYFMYAGKDVLIIYDDLSKHAVAYREMSLLLHRPSGREAYPGDVFYLHSRLLERSAHLSEKLGGGSMTALPIIETQAGDISAYIPTNVISITDGQIFLESGLFHEGQRPAVNVGLSVSRVGGSAQTKAMRQVSGSLRMTLAQYRELVSFSQFGSDLDKSTADMLERGKRMNAILCQKQYSPMPFEKQVLIICVVSRGVADKVPASVMDKYEKELLKYFEINCPELLSGIATGEKMSDELISEIIQEASEFTEDFVCQVSEA